ncbi:MAG: hypothetical protein J1E40_04590 [Oscillospiraceae bacterium]|nr:hypothetical protein [Oscillospiraceae bacterium]
MVYLVDFENVTSAGISGIQRLTKEDKVYIFYTVNAANMSFAAHLNLLSSPAEVIYYNVSSGGKNALDFQLSSFLGYLISKGEEKNFCIISNDKGFEYVKAFWERSGLAAGISIDAAPSINRALLPMEKPFTAKIQQGINNQQIRPETENKPIETEAPDAEKISAVESVSPKEPEQMTQNVQEIQNVPDPEEVMEKKPKKRGRPKGKKSEIKAAEKSPAVKKGKKKTPSPEDTAMETLKASMAKAEVTSPEELKALMDLLKRSEGKQQFYRGIIKIFGMEKGVGVYKTIRPEYTNLTKLVKQ